MQDDTTVTHDLPVDDEDRSGIEDEALNGDVPQSTLLDRLRSRRTEMAEAAASGEITLTLAIPGYNDELFAIYVYRPDAWDRLKKIGQKALKSRSPRKELHAAMDTLIYACEGVLVSDDSGETLEPIDPDGEPTTFDSKLAGLMGFEAKNSREVIRRVFNNDLAITAQNNRVAEWMQGEDEETDEDFSRS